MAFTCKERDEWGDGKVRGRAGGQVEGTSEEVPAFPEAVTKEVAVSVTRFQEKRYCTNECFFFLPYIIVLTGFITPPLGFADS